MHTRRASWLTLAAVLAAAGIAIACLLVFVGSGTERDPVGDRSAHAVAAGFAAALQAHSISQAGSLSCPSARAEVLDDVADVIDDVTAASLRGTVSTTGRSGRAALSITVHERYQLPAPSGGVHTGYADPTYTGELELSRGQGGWCVSDLDAPEPVY